MVQSLDPENVRNGLDRVNIDMYAGTEFQLKLECVTRQENKATCTAQNDAVPVRSGHTL